MIGAHLLYDLVSKGEKVRALKRPGSSLQRIEKIFSFYNSDYKSILDKIEWVEGDILDKDGLGPLLTDVDQIYHLAAIISFDPREQGEIIHTNSIGTANIVGLALSLGISKFCHVSSIAAIGTPPEGIEASEDHPWRNTREHSAYTESKYLSEMEVWGAIFQGLNAVIINPSVVLGPCDWKSGSSVLFSKVWNGLKFYTSGGTGFVDVKDVTSAMQLLMSDSSWEAVKNQRYILNAENVSFREIINTIARYLMVKPPKYLAGRILLEMATRTSALKRLITGTPPSITRDTARSATALSHYDGSKISRTIGFEYTPIDVSIGMISRIFLKEKA